MKIVQVQFSPWDKKYNFINSDDLTLKVGDQVIVDTDLGLEIGEIAGFLKEPEEKNEEIKAVVRLANEDDLSKVVSEDKKKEAMVYCQELIEKYNLPMMFLHR